MPRYISSIESSTLTILLCGNQEAERFVRKNAHFAEYFLLGIELYCILRARFGKKTWAFSLNAALIVAFLDETIQIFSKRAPEVVDIWIDLSGAFCGIVVCMAVRGIRNKFGKQNPSRS